MSNLPMDEKVKKLIFRNLAGFFCQNIFLGVLRTILTKFDPKELKI